MPARLPLERRVDKAIRSGRAPLDDATISFKQRASDSRALAAD